MGHRVIVWILGFVITNANLGDEKLKNTVTRGTQLTYEHTIPLERLSGISL